MLLAVSGLLARVLVASGARFPSGGGVATYAAAGLGERAGRAVGWCFLAGVALGPPVVCLIGGSYVAALAGGGRDVSVVAAALLLILGCTASATRVLRGRVRVAAAASCAAVLGVLSFDGWALIVPLVIVVATYLPGRGGLPPPVGTEWARVRLLPP